MCPGTGRDSHSWDRIDSLEMGLSVCIYDRRQISNQGEKDWLVSQLVLYLEKNALHIRWVKNLNINKYRDGSNSRERRILYIVCLAWRWQILSNIFSSPKGKGNLFDKV